MKDQNEVFVKALARLNSFQKIAILKNYVGNNELDAVSTDWNQLMVVVEKIESEGGVFKTARFSDSQCSHKGDVFEIETNYWCIIEDAFTQEEIADSVQISDTESRIEAVYFACLIYVLVMKDNKPKKIS